MFFFSFITLLNQTWITFWLHNDCIVYTYVCVCVCVVFFIFYFNQKHYDYLDVVTPLFRIFFVVVYCVIACIIWCVANFYYFFFRKKCGIMVFLVKQFHYCSGMVYGFSPAVFSAVMVSLNNRIPYRTGELFLWFYYFRIYYATNLKNRKIRHWIIMFYVFSFYYVYFRSVKQIHCEGTLVLYSPWWTTNLFYLLLVSSGVCLLCI